LDTFDEILERMKIATDTKNDNQLSIVLKLTTNSVISGWKRRNTIPIKRINQICFDNGVNKTWLLTGKGPKFNTSPKSVPQIELLTSFSTLSTNNDLDIPFTLIDPINFLLQEILYTKLILKTFNTVYDVDATSEEIAVKNISDLVFFSGNWSDINQHIIAFIFDSIENATDEYFMDTKSFFLIFQNNKHKMDGLIEFMGYDQTHPLIAKQLAEKAILEFIENFFMFEHSDIFMFLKKNILRIRTKLDTLLSNRSRDPMDGYIEDISVDCEGNDYCEVLCNDDPQHLDSFYIITDHGKRIHDLYKQMIS